MHVSHEPMLRGARGWVYEVDRDVHVIAAKVGAEAKGTQTRCVQLARLRPVTM